MTNRIESAREETHVAASPTDPSPSQGIAPKPFTATRWLARTSFVLALAALAAIPLFLGAAFSTSYAVNVPLVVLVSIPLGGAIASIVASAAGSAVLVWSARNPGRKATRGLALEGLVLGTLAIVPNLIIALILVSTMYFERTGPNGR